MNSLSSSSKDHKIGNTNFLKSHIIMKLHKENTHQDLIHRDSFRKKKIRSEVNNFAKFQIKKNQVNKNINRIKRDDNNGIFKTSREDSDLKINQKQKYLPLNLFTLRRKFGENWQKRYFRDLIKKNLKYFQNRNNIIIKPDKSRKQLDVLSNLFSCHIYFSKKKHSLGNLRPITLKVKEIVLENFQSKSQNSKFKRVNFNLSNSSNGNVKYSRIKPIKNPNSNPCLTLPSSIFTNQNLQKLNINRFPSTDKKIQKEYNVTSRSQKNIKNDKRLVLYHPSNESSIMIKSLKTSIHSLFGTPN